MKTKKNFLKKLSAVALGFVMTLGVGAAGYAASASETSAGTATVILEISGKKIDSSTSYVSNEKTETVTGYSITWNNLNPDSGQIRGNQNSQTNMLSGANFYAFNTKALPGTITSISIDTALVAANTYASVGSSKFTSLSTSATKATVSGTTTSWSFSGSNNTYFAIGLQKGGTSGTVKGNKITITYSTGDTKTLSSIAISSSSHRNFTVGDTFVGESVTATYSDSTTAPVTATYSGYDMSSAGTQTVTASYTEGGVTKTATYTIAVTSGGGGDEGDQLIITSGTLGLSGATSSSGYKNSETVYGIYTFNQGNSNKVYNTSTGGSNSTNAFKKDKDDGAIFIGKSGAYIYNNGAFDNDIGKIEIYANAGASANVSVSIDVGTSKLNTSISSNHDYSNTLSTLNSVYTAVENLAAGYKYFRFQVNNAYNAQVQFRITFRAAATLTGMEIKTNPTKVEYKTGDTFNPAGLVVNEIYSDNSKVEVPYSGNESKFTFSPSLSTELTTSHNKVTVGYKHDSSSTEYTDDVTISVTQAKVLTSISVDQSSQNYKIGDAFQTRTVTANYGDGTSASVTATFSGYNMDVAGDYTVTVAYSEGGVDLSKTYSISVKTISSYTVTGSVNATIGEAWNYSNLTIQAVWESPYAAETLTNNFDITFSPTVASKGLTSVSATITYRTVTKNVSNISAVVDSVINDKLTSASFGTPSAYPKDSSGNFYAISTSGNQTFSSGAVYGGNLTTKSNTTSTIQVRAQDQSGLWVTTSGGVAKSVKLTWDSGTTAGRSVEIYGKNSAYALGDIYSSDSSVLGEKVATISKDDNSETTLSKSFEYIAIKPAGGALYLTDITVKWGEADSLTAFAISGQKVNFVAGGTFSLGSEYTATATYSVSGQKTVTSGFTYKMNGTAITTSTVLTHNDDGKSIVVTYTNPDNDNQTASATAYQINVAYKAPTSVSITEGDSLNISVNQDHTFSATVSDQYAQSGVTWSLANASADVEAIIDEDTGYFLSGDVAGSVDVVATSIGTPAKTASCHVTISANPIVTVEPTEVSGIANVSEDELVCATASNFGSITQYLWESDDSSIASVTMDEDDNDYATISFLHNGSCTVTVTVSGTDLAGNEASESAEIAVTVTRQLSSINVSLVDSTKTYTENVAVPLSDIVIEKVYSDNTTVPSVTSGFSFVSGKDRPTIEDPTVTITYTEDGVTRTGSVNLTVGYAQLSSVSKDGTTYQTEFNHGDSFTVGSNGKMIANYKNSAFPVETLINAGELQTSLRGTLTIKLEEQDGTLVREISYGDALTRADNGKYVHFVYSYHGSNEAPNRYQITVNAPVLDVKYMGQEEAGYTLVTDASTLEAGDVIVFGVPSKGVTATYISNSKLQKVASTFSGDYSKITELGEGTYLYTLGGDSTTGWTFADVEEDLIGASSVKNFAYNQNTTWTISITDGAATIYNTNTDLGRFVYNASSNYFGPYTSDTSTSMLLPSIYKYSIGGDVEKTAHPSSALYDVFAATQDLSTSNWDTYGGYYASFMQDTTSEDYTVLNKGIRDANGNIAEKFLATYDSVLGSNPSLTNFLERPIIGGTYTISYFEADGTPITDASLVTSYKNGVGATLVDAQDKELYSFAGWYDNAQLKGSQVTTISDSATGNKSFYAKWNFAPESGLNEVSENFGMSFKYNYNDTPVITTRATSDAAEYELVTDASTLKEGDKILIVGSKDNSYYALAPYASGNNCKRNDISAPVSNIITADVAYLTLGGSAGNWTLFDGTYYLYAAGGTGSNNYLKGASNADATNAQWSIAIDGGNATIKTADSTVARHTIMHNSGSTCFSCYASGQGAVQIYKMKDSTPSPYTDVTFKLNVKPSGIFDFGDNLLYGEDYGIVVMYNDGKEDRVRYFSFVKDADGKNWIYEEGEDPIEFTLKSNGQFTLNLGDVINKPSRAFTEFTVAAYVMDGDTPILSENTATCSIAGLIEEYYNNPATRTQQVIDLYNIFFPEGK